LGTLRVSRHGALVPTVSAYKARLVLAALLARADQAVSLDWLIDAVWGDRPPPSARRNLQHYVHGLRVALGHSRIESHPGGYLIRAGEALDAALFRKLVSYGGAALRAGDAAGAAERLCTALDLWHGPAYAGFTDSPAIAQEAAQLEELRLTAYERWAEAELALGHHGPPVDVLPELVRAHPYRESLCGHLMRALYGAGRQADALRQFRHIRQVLAEQLGIEPGPQLRSLHERILRGDLRLGPDRVEAATAGPVAVPRELPADVSGFAGREEALKALARLVEDRVEPVAVCAVVGAARVGKSALAVHWAHRVADRFPDGQLYLNLRGHTADPPLTPIEALTALLGALGMGPERVPVEPATAAARYRSLLAGRQMLILLDGAWSAAQVRPLLPASPGSLVVITSRDRLTGLVALDGARRIDLHALTPDESRDLLAGLIGRARVHAEPAAVAELARICAHLPQALRIAAAGLADEPHRTIASYAADLTAPARDRSSLSDRSSGLKGALFTGNAWPSGRVRRRRVPARRIVR
jgi:DNA-binding SARP family transcriptional activator